MRQQKVGQFGDLFHAEDFQLQQDQQQDHPDDAARYRDPREAGNTLPGEGDQQDDPQLFEQF